MQTLVKIGPSNASQGQHGRSNFDKGLHILTTTLIPKQHIIIRTAILYNEINSGQIMENTIYIYIYIMLNMHALLTMTFRQGDYDGIPCQISIPSTHCP